MISDFENRVHTCPEHGTENCAYYCIWTKGSPKSSHWCSVKGGVGWMENRDFETLDDSIRPKLLFIGGYPKGFSEPFSPLTHSGHLLRLIVKRLSMLYDFDVGYYDVWRSAEEEKRGVILPAEREVLVQHDGEGWHLVPLGHHLERAVKKANLPANYYPHPARQSNRLYEMLEADIAVWTFERPRVNTP